MEKATRRKSDKMGQKPRLICLVAGILLGLFLVVLGVSKIVAVGEANKAHDESTLQTRVDNLMNELTDLRQQEEVDKDEITTKESELMDTEADLFRARQGVYSAMQKQAWLDNIPYLIAGITIIVVAVVVYRYA